VAPPLTRRLPVLPIVAAVLVVAAVVGGGLLWLTRGGTDAVTATGSPAPGPTAPATSGGAPPPGVTAETGAAADVIPSPSASAASTASAASPSTASVAASSTANVVASLDALLDGSAAARGNVAVTATNLQSCRVPAAQAAVTFRRARDERNRLAAEATALSGTSAVGAPGVGDAVRAFISLQRSSAQADDAFADWADEVATAGCRGTARHTTNWDLANRYSGDASAAKARFVRLWNPIAARSGLDARSADAI
jgi:hypothetical protein